MPKFKALSSNAYIREYDECSKVDKKKLYTLLSGIVHLAEGSMSNFRKEVKVSENIFYASICLDENTVIKSIWKENEASIKQLVKTSSLLLVLCLKVLNLFNFEESDSPYIENCKISDFLDEYKIKEFNKMMELGEAYLK